LGKGEDRMASRDTTTTGIGVSHESLPSKLRSGSMSKLVPTQAIEKET